jgi:hypothetical protein
MKNSLMKTVMVLLLSRVIVSGEEPQLQYTEDPVLTARRVVSSQVYYVTKQTNLWKQITGKYVRPQPYIGGWVVTGKIDGTNATVVLKNPPAQALQRFTQLKARYQVLKPQYQQALAASESVTKAESEAERQIKRINANPTTAVSGSRADRNTSSALAQAIIDQQTLQNQSVNLSDQVDALKTEIDQLKSEGFNLDGDFVFSCYAVPVLQTVENLPVYDHGRIVQ